MRVDKRQFLVSRNPLSYRTMLVLTAENEAEDKLMDECLGSRVGEDGIISKVSGEVRLSDGFGEHYIRLERVE